MAKQSPEIAEYLASLTKEARVVIDRLRKMIAASAPGASEDFNYGIPVFVIKEKTIVGYAALKEHFSFYPFSPPLIAKYKKDLVNFDISKGTIRFTADSPLPVSLISKIVKERLAEIKAK